MAEPVQTGSIFLFLIKIYGKPKKAKKVIAPKIETPVSKKNQKETIRKNIAVHEIEQEKELIRAVQLRLQLPVTEEKNRNKDFLASSLF